MLGSDVKLSTATHDNLHLAVSKWNEKALREMQTLRAAYAGGVRPPSLYQIWSGLLS